MSFEILLSGTALGFPGIGGCNGWEFWNPTSTSLNSTCMDNWKPYTVRLFPSFAPGFPVEHAQTPTSL